MGVGGFEDVRGGFADRIWISIFRGLKGWHGMAISREHLLKASLKSWRC